MPAFPKRPRCPFYGFHWPEKSHALSDTGANECALDFERNGTCAMEAQGKAPDYDVCPVPGPIRPLLDAAGGRVILYPAELKPVGIHMEAWTRRVMARARTAD